MDRHPEAQAVRTALFRSNTFCLPLRTRRRQASFLAAALLPSLTLAAASLRSAFSETLASSTAVETLSRAAELDPRNPDIQHALGLGLFYAPESPDAQGGLAALQQATRLDPLAAGYWLDLAAACESAGNVACADQGFARAVQLEPLTPRVRWLAANHLLRRGNDESALDDFHGLLIMDRGYSRNVFHLALGTLGDPDAAWTRVVRGTGAPVEVAYVDFLTSDRRFDAADRAWNAAMLEARAGTFGKTREVTLADAEPYLDALIARGESNQTLVAWRDLQALGAVPAESQNTANLVTNGGFRHSPLNAGLDWRLDPGPYTVLSFPQIDEDQTSYHAATHALRLDFNAARNETSEPVCQFVPVVPGRSYALSADVRSEAITSDSGPRLRVLDPACVSCLDVSTDGTAGTTGWHKLVLDFTAPPATHFVRLSIFRRRSRSFPSEITGTFWLTAVSLTPTATPAAGASLALSDPK
jgi:tetratricopeptide (TPR) repeat protein